MQTQGHFDYDALKAGGVTCSYFRLGPNPIKASHEIAVGCTYLAMQKKKGGVFVLNSPWTTLEHQRANLMLEFRQLVVGRKLVPYHVGANSVARQAASSCLA